MAARSPTLCATCWTFRCALSCSAVRWPPRLAIVVILCFLVFFLCDHQPSQHRRVTTTITVFVYQWVRQPNLYTVVSVVSSRMRSLEGPSSGADLFEILINSQLKFRTFLPFALDPSNQSNSVTWILASFSVMLISIYVTGIDWPNTYDYLTICVGT